MKRVLEEEGRELWDGKVQEVKVTDISDRTVTLRILVSAKDPSASWDVRCLVRANAGFLQKDPQWLPISRTEMRPSNSHPEGVSLTAQPASEVKRSDLTSRTQAIPGPHVRITALVPFKHLPCQRGL